MKPQQEIDMMSDKDFSLVLGGPFFQLLRKVHLEGSHLELIKRRLIVFVLITFAPLLTLTLIDNTALPGSTGLSFLSHADVYAKFLFSIPLMIAAELLVNQRLRLVVDQFQKRELIPEESVMKFDAAKSSAMKLRNSYLAEILMLVIVYSLGIQVVFRQVAVNDVQTWFAIHDATGVRYSTAGWWYAYISTPIFQFLLLRWYYRLFIWFRFMVQVSRIKLNLIPTHPDKVGGLGFLSNTLAAFTPLAIIHGMLLSGVLADHIFHSGASLPEYRFQIAGYAVYVVGLLIMPQLVFAGQLAKTKRMGFRNYGNLAAKYVREFDNKWIKSNPPAEEQLIGSADIQSLADLANSYEVIQKMQLVPLTRQNIITLGVAVLLPLSPLLLTIMPLEELIKKLIGILL